MKISAARVTNTDLGQCFRGGEVSASLCAYQGERDVRELRESWQPTPPATRPRRARAPRACRRSPRCRRPGIRCRPLGSRPRIPWRLDAGERHFARPRAHFIHAFADAPRARAATPPNAPASGIPRRSTMPSSRAIDIAQHSRNDCHAVRRPERMTAPGGTLSDISTCEASMRLASKASGTTSVAPAVLSSSRRESSGVRTSTGTSVRSRRRLRRMASEVRVSENEMTTALALARPTSSSTCCVGGIAVHHRAGRSAARRAPAPDRGRWRCIRSSCASSTRATFLADAAEAAEDHVLALGHAPAWRHLRARWRSCGGPRSPNNSRATRLLLARITGASTMPSTTATSMRLR